MDHVKMNESCAKELNVDINELYKNINESFKNHVKMSDIKIQLKCKKNLN